MGTLVVFTMSCGGGRGGSTDADGNGIGVGLKMRIISGNNQTAKKSTPFALPIVARVESPTGDPVPSMTVNCFQTTSTDAVITGPKSFTTDTSGLISTTVTSASEYDEETKIKCELPGTPNAAVFTLTSVFVVDHVEWVPTFEPSVTYTADNTTPMVTFKAQMIDPDGFVIDVSNTKNWLTLSVQTSGDPNPLGTTQQFFTNGIATFSDIKYIKADTITLRATHNKSGKYVEQVINVSPNTATQTIAILPGQTYSNGFTTLAQAVTGTPTNFTADDTFNVEVRATDDYFNTTSDTSAISITTPQDSVDTEPAGSNFVSGVQTFTVSPVQAKTGWFVRPISAFATNNDSSTFTIGAGSASELITKLPGQTYNPGQVSLANAITGVPTTQTAGTAFSTVVYATDAEYNQVATSPSTTLTTSDPSDTEPAAQNLSAGTKTFTVTNVSAGTQTVTASATGYNSNASTSYTVKHGAATQLVITSQPAATITAGQEIAPIAEIRDAFGNIVTSGADATANVTLSLFSGTGTLSGTVTTAAVAGVADFTGLGAYVNLVGAKVIRLTKADTSGSGGTSAKTVNTNSFTIVHGAASVLAWTTQPLTSTPAGSNMTPVIAIRDAYTNVVTSGADSTASITLTLQSGTGTLNGTVTKAAVSGIVTFTASEGMNITVTGAKVLRATMGALTQDSASFNVTHGSATQLVFTTQPIDPTPAGSEIAPVVEIQDAYGNAVTTGADSTAIVAMTLQSGTGTLGGTVSMTAVLGVANFTGLGMNLNLVGTKVLRATKSSTVGSGGTVSLLQNSNNFDITPAIASQLVFTTQPANNTVAGTNLLPVIEIRDTFGNLVTTGADATASITLNIQSGTGTLGGTVTVAAVGGVASFTAAEAVNIDLVGSKTLRATKADLSGSGGAGTLTQNSSAFTIRHAAANQLAYTTHPATGAAGTNLVPVVEIRDAFGNVTTSDSSSTITLTIQTNPGSSTLAGTTTRTVSSGVATWTAAQGMFLNKIGTGYVLRASDGTRTVDSNAFNVTPAAASSLAFTSQPATAVAGTNQTPVVEIRDVYGNVRTNDSTSTITLTIQTNPGSSTLAGTTALTVVNGVATWTATEAMFLNKVGTGYVLRASDGTRTVNSSAFNVTHNTASVLAFTTQPATAVAGTNQVPAVEMRDAYGNVTTSDSTSVITLTIQTNPGSSTLAGTTTRTVVNGVATWTAAQAMYLDKVGTGYVLQASDGTRTVNSSAFNVTPAAAASLAFTTQPATGVAGTNLVPVVEIRDAFGNVRTGDNSSVISLSIQTNPGSSTLAGTTTRTVSAGVATWTAAQLMYLNKVGTGYVLRASDGTRTVDSNAFNVTHNVANTLAFTTQPATGSAGTNLTPVVEIRDAYGNVTTSDSTSTITLTIQTNPGSSTLAGTTALTVSSGVATWTAGEAMYLNKVGTGYKLQASDGTRTVVSSAFNVTHGTASVLAYTAQPATAIAGTNQTPVVEIRDAYGNVVTSDSTSVITLTIQTNPGSSTLAGTTTRTVSSGVATWTAAQGMFLNKIGTGYVLRASDGTRTVDSNSFNVTPAAASSLAFTSQPATAVAGTNQTPVIEIRDVYGNVRTGDNTSTITLTIQTNPGSSTLAGTTSLTVVNGVATWTAGEAMYLNKVGVGYKLRASDGTRTVDSNAFNVNLGAPSALAFTTQPASGIVGTALTPVVEIRDAYGNVMTTDSTSTITLTIQTNPGSSTLAGTTALTVSSGVATWTGAQAMSLNKVGVGYVLRASDGTRTVDSNAFNETHAAASQLVYTTQPASSLAGANLLPVLEIRDSLGNVITSGADATANVTLSLQSGTGTLGGTVTVAAVAGVASFTATQAVNINLVGSKTLRATKANTTGGGGTASMTVDSNAFTISHNSASVLAYTTQPATAVAGTNQTPVVEIRDAYGNVTTSDSSSTITLTIQTNPGSSTLAGTTSLTVVNGVATWTAGEAMFLNKVGTGYKLRASDGTRTVDSSAFNVTHNSASVLAYTAQPATAVAGTNQTPVVEIRDAYGNVVTSDSTSVITLTIQTNPGASTLAGTTTRTVVNGVATWTAAQAMFLNKVGTGYVLRASDGTRTIDSSAFNVTHNSASVLAYTAQPATAVAGTNQTPVVEIRDAYGNVVTSDSSSTITLTIQTNPGSSTLAGTTSHTVVSGVATWTGADAMYLNKVGTGYKLRASDGTRTVDSNAFNVTVGAANNLAFATQPANSLAGDNLYPVVQIRDVYGNVITGDSTSTITLTLQANPGGSTLAGTTALTVSSGVATWTNAQGMYLNVVANGYVLRASDGTRTVDSNAFNIVTAAASQLAFTSQPANATAGANLLPVIAIQDSLGNVVTTGPDSTANVTISLQSGTGTLSGTLTVAAVAGVASFTATQAVYINLVGAKTLRATKASTTGSGGVGVLTQDSNSFTISHAAANSLVYTTPPASGTAGTNLLPVIEIRDTYGNVTTSDNTSTITLTIQTNPGSSTLAGTTALTVVNGVATWTATEAMYLNKVGTGYVLRASDGTRTVNSAAFNVTVGAASALAFATPPASGTAGTNLVPVVEIRDAYGNVRTGDSSSVITLSIQTNPGSSTLAGTVTRTVSSGVATWTAAQAMFLNKVGTGYVLQATDGTLTVNSAAFNVTHAAASVLAYTSQPSTGVAGTNQTPVVEIRDTYGNVTTSDNTSTITFTIQTNPGSSTLAGTTSHTVVNGVATWTGADGMYLNKVGTGYKLRASDGTRTLDSNAFNVTPASAGSLAFTTPPATGTAGTNLLPVVEIRDAYGNVTTGDSTSTITLTIQTNPGSSTLAGTTALTVSSGVATWTATQAMYLNKVGTGYVLQASDGTRTVNSAAFNVTPAAASALAFTTPPATGTAGTNLLPIVEIRDAYGNVRTGDSTSTITLTIQTNPGSSTLAGTTALTVSSGVATWTATQAMYLNKVGTGYVLQASDGTRTVNSAAFNVTPAAASALAFTTPPASGTAGTNLLPVVEIRDAYGNVRTGDSTSTITLTIQTNPGSSTLAGTTALTVSSGIATWTATQAMYLNKVGTGYVLQASDGTRTVNSAAFNVTPAAASALAFTTPPATGTAGTNLLPVVEIRDAYGNVRTGDSTSTITLTIQTNPGSSTLAGTTALTVASGVATWTATQAMYLNKVGTGYVLQASDGTRTVNSAAFNVTPAAASALAFTTSPASGQAGTALLPVVEIRDAYGNVRTGDNSSNITLSIQTNPGSSTLAGTKVLTVSSGVATWTATENMYLDKVGTGYVLQASDGTRTVNSAAFNVTPAAASQIVYTTQPANVTAGSNLLPVLEIRDAHGNVVTTGADATANVTISLQSGTGTLSGSSLTVAAVAGVASFTATQAAYIDLVGSKTLRATKANTTGGGGTASMTVDSNAFTISHNTASVLAYTTQPATGTAGTNLVPVVEIRDAYTNVVTSDNSSVITLTIQTNPGSSTLAGTKTRTVVNGVATWTGAQAMYLNKVGTGYVLRASDGTRTVDSAAFNVTPSTANSLAFTTSPASGTAGTNLLPVVEIRDAYGNVTTGDSTSTITLTVQTNPGSSTLAGTTALTVSSGVATWTATEAMYLNKVGTGYVLQASDGTRTVNSAAFNVTVGAASALAFATPPASGTAGTNLTPVVEIRDAYGNVRTGDSTSTITLTIQTNPGSSTLAGTIALTVSSGVATWTATQAMYLNKVGTGYVLRASDGTRTVDSAAFNVTVGAASVLAFATPPASGTAGTNLTPVVEIRDAYGNVRTGDSTSTITLTIQTNPGSSTLAGTTALTVSSGVATWTATQAMYLNKVGTGYVLRASDGTRTVDSAAFNVTVGAASALAFTTPPASGTAGTNLLPVVEIRDAYGNVRTGDSTSTITLTIQTNPGSSTLAGTTALTVSSGVATWTATQAMYLNKVGTGYVLRASDGTRTVDSAAFNVTVGAASALAFTTPPASGTAGTNLLPVVEIRDAYGNVRTGDSTSTITLTIQTNPGSSTLAGTTALTVASGVATWTATQAMYLNKVGIGYVLQASDGTRTVNSAAFNVTHAAANSLAFTTSPATGPAGTNLLPVVEIRDAYGNVTTSDSSSSITLSIQTNPGSSTLAGTKVLTVASGVATWTGTQAMYLDKVGTGYVLQASDGTRTVNSAAFNVTPAAAATIVYTTQPANVTAGSNLLPVLEIRDSLGNVVTTGADATANVTISLQSGTGTLSGSSLTVAAVAGVASFTATQAAYINLVGAKTLRATKANTTGGGGTASMTVDSNSFTISHSTASVLAYTSQPATNVAGTIQTPVIEIRDAYGNVTTSDSSSTITLTIQTNPGSSTLAGTTALTVSSGVATWTATQAMYLNKVGTGYVLRASDGTRTVDSSTFNVTPAAASALAFTTPPASGTAGTNLLPVIEIRDAYGNVRTGDSTSTITLTIQTNPGSSTLAGTTALTVSSGVATWTATQAMYLNKVGTGYVLRASDGTRTVDSAAFNVTVGAASALAFTTPPATGTAGTNLTPVVEIRDAYGNVRTGDSTSTITLTIQTNPGSSTLAGTTALTVSSGVATWTATQAMYLNKVGTGYVLQASDGTRTVNSAAFNVTVGAASALAFATSPASGAAGTNLLPVVEIRDAYGNVRTGDSTSTITLTIQTNPGSSTLAGTTALTVSSGVATWTATQAMYLNKVGTGYVLQASDGTLTVNSAAFNVTVGAASALAFATPPATGTAGTNLLPVVEIRDAYGNVRTGDSTSTITLTIQTNPGSSTLAGTTALTVSSGVATWTATQAMYLNKVGTGYVLQASDGTRTVNSAAFNVTPAAASALAFTTPPASGTAGTNLLPVVEIRDAYGNVRTGDSTSTITLTIQTNPGSSTLAGTTALTVSSGVATWTATQAMYLNKVGTGYVLQASDGTRTVNSSAFNVTHSTASILAYTAQPATAVSGTNQTPVVEIRDAYGNVTTSDSTSVITLTIQTNPGSSTLAGTTTRTVVNGVATWTGAQGMFLDKVGTGYVLQASDGTRTVNSNTFNVTVGAASALAFTTPPATGTAGTNLTPVVEIRDAYGNVRTGDNTSTITLTIQTNPGSSTLAGTTALTVSSGVATWTATQAMYLNKVGTGYVLQASDGTRTVNSSAFNVTVGAASALAFATSPSSGPAGTNLTPVVEIRDAYGNVRTGDSSSNITLSIQTNPSSSTLAGTKVLTVSSGVATWTATENMYLDKVGTGYVLQATDGTRTVNSASFNVTPAAASTLVYTTQPANVTAGSNLLPVIEIRDSLGNVVTTGADATANVTISLQTGTGTLSGSSLTVAAVAGVASFTATQAAYINLVGSKTLRATKASTTGSGGVGVLTQDSNSFTISHNSASVLAFTTSPSSSAAGAALLPVVEIRDAYGNVTTSDSSSTITLTIQTNPGSSTLGGTAALTVSSGVATWIAGNGLNLNKVGTGYVLQASDGTRTVNSSSFNITPGAASSLAFTTHPATGTAGTYLLPVVEIRDANGNVRTNDSTSTITLTIQTNPGSSTLAGTTALTVTNGVATWTAGQLMYLNKVGTGYVLRASDGTRTVDSNSFNVTVGAAAALAFTTSPATGTAGSALLPVVEIRDANGNVRTNDSTSTITLTIQTNPGSSTLGGTAALTVTNGVATWVAGNNLNLNKVGTGYVLQASDGTRTVNSSAFNVTVGAASVLAFATQPSTGTAGTPLVPVIEIRDANGNVVTTDSSSTITLTIQTNPGSSTLANTTSLNVTNGVATWTGTQNMYLDKVGTGYVLQATDGTRTVNSSAFNVTVGAASQLAFTTSPASGTAGTNLVPVVAIQDAYGNTRTGDSSSNITLSISTNPSSGTLAGTKTLTVSGGVATWTGSQAMFIDKVGTGYVLQATDGTRTVNSAAFNVTVGSANSLAFATSPATGTAGTVLLPSVEIRDSQGNVVTTDSSSTITLSIQTNPGSSTLGGTASLQVTNGVATWTGGLGLYLNKVGTGYVLQATDGTRTVNSSAFNVTVGAANQLAFTTQPSTGAAGTALVPVVAIQDQYGNTRTGDSTSSITISIQTNPGSSTLAGTKVLTVSSGVATWTGTQNMYLDKVGTGYVLQATDGTRTVNSNTFDVTPAAANSLVWTTSPSNSSAGTALVPVVESRDQYGNTRTNDSSTSITLSIQTNPSSGTLFGTKVLTLSSGVATWTGTQAMYLDKVGTGYILQASDGTRTANSSSFNISHGAASQIVYTTQPANNTAPGSALTPVLEIRDTYNNLVTTGADATANVTLSLQSGTGTLSGTVTRAASGGVITYVAGDAVAISNGGSKTLRATKADTTPTGTASVYVDSSSFTILAATADHLAFSTQPANSVAGANLLPVIQVQASDNSVVTAGADSTANITLSLISGTGTLSGTVTLAAVNGVATFTATQAVYINLIGAKTLRATKADMSGSGGTTTMTVDSNSFTISHAAASQLAYTTQPADGTVAGSALTPVVEVRDTYGNVVSTGAASTATITLTKQSGTGSFTGTLTKAAVAGVASFPSGQNITTTTAGAYVLRASDGTRTVDSSTFNMVAGAVATLTWTAQPDATRTAGQNFSLGTVTAKDANNNTCTNSTDTITFAILDYDDGTTTKLNPTGAALQGTVTVALSSGTATLTSANIQTVGTNYYLQATDNANGVQTTAASATQGVTISAAAASKVTFQVVAGTWVSGSNVVPGVKAAITDAYGNVITGNGGATAIVLSIGTNPGGAGTISGTTSVAPTSGVSTFNSVKITGAANGFTLSATTTGTVYNGTSGTFNVTSASGLNFEHAIEILDTQRTNKATAGGAIIDIQSKTPIDTNDYSGTVSYYFEIVATSNANKSVTLVNNAGTTVTNSTISVANTANYTRYRSAAMTMTTGADFYRINIPKFNNAGDLKIHAARVIVKQAGGYDARFYIPMTAGLNTAMITTDVAQAIDTTTSTSFTQGSPNRYSIYEKDTSILSTIQTGSTGWGFDAIISNTTGGTATAALFNKTTGLQVTGAQVSTTATTPTLVSVTFDNTATNFTNANDFEVRIKTSSGTASIYKSNLWVRVNQMYSGMGGKYATWSRTSLGMTAASTATTATEQRQLITKANWSNPVFDYECTAAMTSAGNEVVDLAQYSTADSAGTATQITSSTNTFTASSRDLLRTTGLTFPNATDRYQTRITGTTGTVDLADCKIVVRGN